MWHCPVPFKLLPTTNRDESVCADQTPLPLAPHPGAFGVKRKHHTHEGVDLYCPVGTKVSAVEPGEVVAVITFTGPNADPPSPWWLETFAVLVEGRSGVVVYGEIMYDLEIWMGKRVVRGETIGVVRQVLTKDKGYPMSMLHLELHVPGTRNAFDWVDERPPSLLDPTPYLKEIAG
jgi:murein DD-endopeptidase MepM/ murein hydrolase activator NlpD